MTDFQQMSLWSDSNEQLPNQINTQSTTFIDNMKLPVHRWFRFSAGFSAEWVRQVINHLDLDHTTTLFDPFAGSGTALLAGEEAKLRSYGLEAHSFVRRIAQAKSYWYVNPYEFRRLGHQIAEEAQATWLDIQPEYPPLIHKCYSNRTLSKLHALKHIWLKQADESPISELAWLALTASLRISSPVGTSNMELIQPKKRKSNHLDPFIAFSQTVNAMHQDMIYRQTIVPQSNLVIYQDDARTCTNIETDSIDLVITSPPYANNFDYADATRLEMMFWGEVQGWGDLQAKIRQHLVRSCTQQVSAEKLDLETVLQNPSISSILADLAPICQTLATERLQHGGQKKYHLMVAAYFVDLAQVWQALRRVCEPKAKVCFVVGDSAPYGIYVPVDEFLGRLAVAAGFSHYTFEKTRDRNTKWKNRKHRIPLKEGRLWVQG